MTGRTSQNAAARDPSTTGIRLRCTVLSLVEGLAFLAAVFVAVAYFPDSELGRTTDAHLSQLADPESWFR